MNLTRKTQNDTAESYWLQGSFHRLVLLPSRRPTEFSVLDTQDQFHTYVLECFHKIISDDLRRGPPCAPDLL